KQTVTTINAPDKPNLPYNPYFKVNLTAMIMLSASDSKGILRYRGAHFPWAGNPAKAEPPASISTKRHNFG
ncbi:MAG: hypothetical protein SV775_14610, partial [Thermodesulfobacteriota bacterium]|nr:hypothetical protein [Thermodesulfobacteriota bacterium]